MKPFQFALILALILPLGGNAMAASSTASHSGTSSYKSGFSSQKSSRSTANKAKFGSFSNKAQPTAPAPANATPAPANRGSFGAFGNGATAGATPDQGAPRSALSRDLQQSQAQSNALNTLDARRNAANGQPLPPLNDRVPGVDRAQQQPYGPAPAPYGQQPYNQAPPVVVQQGGGSGLGAALMGFMLGRATSASAHQGYYPANGAAVQPNGQNGSVASAPAPDQPRSFGGSVLRLFAWLLLLGVLGWIIYFVVRALKRGKSRRSGANYSFERD